MEFKNQDLSHETLIELIKSYQNDLKLMIQEKKCSKCQQLVDQTEGKSLETMSHFQKISDLEFDTNPQIDGLQVPEAFNQTTLTGSE
jgi:succinate dehydrogenase/fumarate reductase-like Fe-S protein